MQFILFHGSFGSPTGSWLPDLKIKLEGLGQEVITQQYPVDDWETMVKNGPEVPLMNQNLTNWLNTFEKEVLPKFKKSEKKVFVGHSLGPLFMLHVVERFNIHLDCAIFVSPFLDKLDMWEFNHANESFYKTDFDFKKLEKLIPVSYVLYSDSDPYVRNTHSILFGKALGSSLIFVKKAGHMNSEVNLNEFPLVFDLCGTRLDLGLFQGYLLHKEKQGIQNFVKNRGAGVLNIQPEDIMDEGIYHFTNLKKSGFATFYLGIIDFWDPDSRYMNECRQAAKRTGDITRVFILDSHSKVDNNVFRRQLQLDLDSGIKVFVCRFEDIKSFTPNPDFGIWDDEYVCTVKFNKSNEIEQVEMNSLEDHINEMKEIAQKILKKSVKIEEFEDLKKIRLTV